MTKKNVLITGSGSGLGEALAIKFSSLNYHVCLAGRSVEKLEKVSKLLTGSYSIHQLDVSNNSQVLEVTNNIKDEIGQIDILVNNAGVGAFELVEDISEEEIHQMIDINLKGTIFCTKAVLPSMKTRNEGNIVNVVSTAGVEGKVTEAVYCASKFGVRGFTESLLLEVEDTDIRLNAIYMGGMNTNFWDGILEEEITKGMMDPDDIADIIIGNIKYRKNINVSDVVIKNKN